MRWNKTWKTYYYNSSTFTYYHHYAKASGKYGSVGLQWTNQ